jgi:hypothetical protein
MESLNWKASTTLESGVKKTYEWFLAYYLNIEYKNRAPLKISIITATFNVEKHLPFLIKAYKHKQIKILNGWALTVDFSKRYSIVFNGYIYNFRNLNRDYN